VTTLYATVLEHVPSIYPTTRAILTILNRFDDPQPDSLFLQADGTYLPGVEILTAIQRVNELLPGNPVAQQVARELKELFDLPPFRDPIPAYDENSLDRDEVGAGAPSCQVGGDSPRRYRSNAPIPGYSP
jgi:hypothetical protein